MGEVGEVLERAVRRIERHLDRRCLLGTRENDLDLSGECDPECNLATSAVSGQSPPAGPQWSAGLQPLRPRALAYDKPLCASLDGFTLHAATRAGGLDVEGREALLRYVLRPPISQERVEQRPDGLVRITLKKAYKDGTVAVDMDPLSLLCRLATSVPLPRFHTIHYAGVLAAASPWRSRLAPPLPSTAEDVEPEKRVRKSGYRPWAELLQRTFSVDVLTCPSCQGRMRLLAVVKNPAGMAQGQAFASLKGGFALARYLAAVGELTEVPGRSPPRAPPYWKSQVLRRQALGDQGEGGDNRTDHEAALASGREARNSAAVAEPRARREFWRSAAHRKRCQARPPAPVLRLPGTHRRTAAARIHWQTALVSLTLAGGCARPDRSQSRR